MSLNWRGTLARIDAFGDRAVYRIERMKNGLFLLNAEGHDSLPLLDVAPGGAVFTRLDDAREAAAELDSQPTLEGMVSGE